MCCIRDAIRRKKAFITFYFPSFGFFSSVLFRDNSHRVAFVRYYVSSRFYPSDVVKIQKIRVHIIKRIIETYEG